MQLVCLERGNQYKKFGFCSLLFSFLWKFIVSNFTIVRYEIPHREEELCDSLSYVFLLICNKYFLSSVLVIVLIRLLILNINSLHC